MGYRSLQMKVENKTGQKLVLIDKSLQHGKWDTEPTDVMPNTDMTFKAESKDGALIGINGVAHWKGQVDGGAFTILFDKPLGAGATKVDPSCPSAYQGELTGDPAGHHSSVTITFSKS